jgi:Tfp pilus assembly protein PilO
MKNLPKEKRDQLILVGLGTVVITVGLYYGLITLQQNALQTTLKSQGEQQAKLSDAQRLTGNSGSIQKGLEAATAQLKGIEATMPSGDMYSWIILTVNTFKEKYQVDIPQFSREVQSDIGMYAKYPYKAATFSLRGSAFYHDLGRFISDFENTFPYMRIQNIELEPSAGNQSANPADGEKLAFKLDVITLVNVPN